MSTVIRDLTPSDGPHSLSPYGDSAVTFAAKRNGGHVVVADMTRADFFDAIRTELGAIVIDKTELPEVESTNGGWPLIAANDEFGSVRASGPGSPNGHPEWHRSRARAHLALAAYLEANPPTDPKVEAKVESLYNYAAQALREFGLTPEESSDKRIIRTLIQSGRIDIKDPS